MDSFVQYHQTLRGIPYSGSGAISSLHVDIWHRLSALHERMACVWHCKAGARPSRAIGGRVGNWSMDADAVELLREVAMIAG